MAAMVRYAILGPVELCDGERRVAVGGARQVALLAMLLVNANRAVAADRLIEAVWYERLGFTAIADQARSLKLAAEAIPTP